MLLVLLEPCLRDHGWGANPNAPILVDPSFSGEARQPPVPLRTDYVQTRSERCRHTTKEQGEAAVRFVLAISALVLSGIMLVLGIGQVTFLAGPHQVTYSQSFAAPNGIAVLDADQFGTVPGQANVVVEGENAFVAVGHVRDVAAWTAPFEHAQATADTANRSLEFSTVQQDAEAAEEYADLIAAEESEEIAVPSPYGSDLWQEQRGRAPEPSGDAESEATEDGQAEGSAVESVRLPVSLAPDQAVLVSVADSASPATLSIEWVQDRRTPWAGPLLVAGGALALIGALLYLLAVDHDRRGLGPRRGRRGPLQGIRNIFGGSGRKTASKPTDRKDSRARRAVALPALAVTAALALSGCSPSYWPDFSSQADEAGDSQEVDTAANGAPVPVSPTQITRIIADVSALAGAADDALDATELESRFTGDALAEREANYIIRQAVSDYEVVVPRITDDELGYQLVQSTENWPRTIFVVVASDTGESVPAEGADQAEAQDSPSLALILTQQSPHENFQVSRTIALRGGITMPEAAPAEEGTALLSDDLQTLALTPAEVGPAYAAVLQGGPAVAEAEKFDLEGDSLVERSGAAWVAQSAQAAAAGGQGINYSVSVAQSDAEIMSLSTGVGGALLATTVLETRVEAPSEGSRWRPTVPKSLSALSGLEGQQEMLVSVVAHQLLFFVPSGASNEKIQLLGYTSDLISARNS